jgi:CBS domain-containing protein
MKNVLRRTAGKAAAVASGLASWKNHRRQTINISLKVRDFMMSDVVTVTPDTEITRVVRILIEKDISGLVVVEPGSKVVGIVTERDCIATMTPSGYFDQLGGPISDFMSAPVATVDPDDNLVDVAVRLTESKYRRFPVVEDGRLIGIIARRDVLRALGNSAWFTKPGP